MEENIGGYLSDLKMEKYFLNKLHIAQLKVKNKKEKTNRFSISKLRISVQRQS